MTVFEWIFGGLLIIMALFLVFAVLMQPSKQQGLSGTIVGGADNFMGKSKQAKKEAVYSTLTTAFSIAFAIIAVVLYIYIATHTHAH